MCRASSRSLPKRVTSTAPRRGLGCGAKRRTTSRTALARTARRLTCLPRTGCRGQKVGPSGAFPHCSARTASAIGNALGLELAAFNRSRLTITDFADSRLSTEIFVAEVPALILAKGSKIGERMREPRKGPVRSKDLGDLWRLMAVADPAETTRVIDECMADADIRSVVSQSVEWTADALRDPVSVERAKMAFDTFVDPTVTDRVFDLWRDVFPDS